MRSVGGVLLALTAGVVFGPGFVASGTAAIKEADRHSRVLTDGRLRPGHLETIRVVGFPGKGDTQISFFPGAICEDACGGRTFTGDRTNSRGAARFRVRMPGTFLDSRNRPVYFRDRERIEISVIWEGSNEGFDVATANPEPVIVRTHGGQND